MTTLVLYYQSLKCFLEMDHRKAATAKTIMIRLYVKLQLLMIFEYLGYLQKSLGRSEVEISP